MPVENSITMLQAEQNKALREIDAKFEELKKSVPAHILMMKICDVMLLNDFNDIVIEEKMTNLNVTVKETVQKADEGEQKKNLWFIWFSSIFILLLAQTFHSLSFNP
jgi:hypothetical protein